MTLQRTYQSMQTARVGHIVGTGTPLVAGDIVLSANWGNTATVTLVTGTDTSHSFLVTCQGSGIAGNPQVTVPFKSAYGAAPRVTPVLTGGTGVGTLAPIFTTPSTTGYTFTYQGTPITATTYLFTVTVIG